MAGKGLNKKTALDFRWQYLVCLLLVISTLLVYRQVQEFDFVNYDDNLYVLENPQAHGGLSRASIAWSFKTTHAVNWHPLTWLSHLMDVQLYGLNAGPHHRTNLIFHVVNTLLLFLVFQKMTGALWRSAFVAALFALHPLHVESVAWVAERKDVLSTFFGLLTILTYIRYTRYPGRLRYGVMLLCFILGLMAKPMLVTLPFVLLLLDYWPLGRLNPEFAEPAGPSIFSKHALAPLFKEKIPLFFLSAVSCLVTFWVQYRQGGVGPLFMYSFGLRITNALVAYVRYMLKTAWPHNLAVFYPYPEAWPWWKPAGALLLLAAISFQTLRKLKSAPYLIVGWLWFLGTLLPVIGLVQVGSQAMADRYTYVPLIGLFVAIAWGLNDLFDGRRYKRWGLGSLGVAVLAALALSTWGQIAHWRNSVSLFSHAAAVTPLNPIVNNNLGTALEAEGRPEEAIKYYLETVTKYPHYADTYVNLGNALVSVGKTEEAVRQYRKAAKLDPGNAKAHYNLGLVYQRRGEFEKALAHYRRALQLKPDYAEAHNNLGGALAMQGRAQEAIRHFQEAVRLRPDYAGARRNLDKLTRPEAKKK